MLFLFVCFLGPDQPCPALDADLAEREYSDPEVAGGRRFAFKWQLPNNGVAIYQGQWLDARPSGHGKYKYATKASYEGTFVQGKRHGKGKMMYQTGEYYDGDWVRRQPLHAWGVCVCFFDAVCVFFLGRRTMRPAARAR